MNIQEHLTEDEIEFMEHFSDPTSLTENLFPENIDAPQMWPNCKRLYIRPYQFAMQNYSYIYADDPELSESENLGIKVLAGTCYSIGARNLGKSWWVMIDCILTVIHGVKEIVLASCTGEKIKKVADPIAETINSHKFLKIFHLKNSKKDTVTLKPLKVTTGHGSVLYGVNEQIDGNKPGFEYQSKHYWTRFYEEYSYATNEGEKQAVDAVNMVGHIERLSGIPALCVGAPLGKILSNQKLKNWIWRLPQYVSESWSKKIQEARAEEYGGETSASYGLNVLAKELEGAYGFWDIPRLKEKSMRKTGIVKNFEISRETYEGFESRLIVDRPSGTEQVYLCFDVGYGSAPTEIAVIFYDGNKYKYHYNISLYRLIAEEQAEVVKFLYDKLGGAFIAQDASGDNGVVVDNLIRLGIDSDHVLKVFLQENIDVDFEREDPNDSESPVLIDKDGDPIMKQENCLFWAMKELELLMYGGKMDIPPDPKFLNQFTNVIATQTKNKTLWGSKGADHLHQSFQVFAICRFFNEFKNMKDSTRPKRCYGIVT